MRGECFFRQHFNAIRGLCLTIDIRYSIEGMHNLRLFFFFFGRTNKFFRVKIVADFLLFLVKKKIKTYLCNESSFARILLVSVSFVIRIDSFERGRRLFRGTRNRLKSIIYAPRLAWKRGAKGRTGGKRFIFFIRSDGE